MSNNLQTIFVLIYQKKTIYKQFYDGNSASLDLKYNKINVGSHK